MVTLIINQDVLTRTGEKNIEWLRSLFLDRWLGYNLSSHWRIPKLGGMLTGYSALRRTVDARPASITGSTAQTRTASRTCRTDDWTSNFLVLFTGSRVELGLPPMGQGYRGARLGIGRCPAGQGKSCFQN